MTYLKFTIGIFVILAASRFIPHPPNFTSLIALSFYIPALLGRKYLPALVLSFAVTDIFIGFHSTILFTWGGVIFIGLLSGYFKMNKFNRLLGALTGAFIFFILTNFGVWSQGSYGYNLDGLIICYTMALPFFYTTIISTICYSILIELVLKLCSKAGYLKEI
tara:strand:- start:3264 stop:3752 length:489 start_codon:yes stop_codon:yes gene_type:complete